MRRNLCRIYIAVLLPLWLTAALPVMAQINSAPSVLEQLQAQYPLANAPEAQNYLFGWEIECS